MGVIQDIIVRVANSLGVDPRLALSIAQEESGYDPNVIGDGGHSVGLFQLNDRGEGAGMSVAQRQDPTTNAQIALSQVAAVESAHPDWSPGTIAAAAQRPSDRAGYAAAVDAIYRAGPNGGSSPPPRSSGGNTSVGLPSPGDILSGAGDIIDQFNPVNAVSDFVTGVGQDLVQGLFRLTVYGALLAAGAALVVLGGWRSVAQSGPGRDAASAATTLAAVA